MTHTEFPTQETAFSTSQSIEREQESLDRTREFEETQQGNPPSNQASGILTGTGIGPAGSLKVDDAADMKEKPENKIGGDYRI